MNIPATLKDRFRPALAALVPDPAKVAELLELIRPAQDAKFGDYQANFAMPLGKQLGKPPREVASQLIAATNIGDLCQPPEIAGPGFINLRLKDEWLTVQLNQAVHDDRLGIPPVENPRTIVVDYSSPNVAKPMHVGHIRSTVIGDSLTRTLRFLGHRVISDNHIGDWGTQFGMIIYGYKHFVDRAAYQANPVVELARLYKLVHRLVDYRESLAGLPAAKQRLVERLAEVERLNVQPKTGDKAADKKLAQQLSKAQDAANAQTVEIAALESKIAAIDSDPVLSKLAAAHSAIDSAVLEETAKLH